jgi:YfiH family protein
VLPGGRVRVVQTAADDGDAGARWARAEAFGWALPIVWLEQVHGDRVVEARFVSGSVEADAVVRRADDAVVVGIRTADCVPIVVSNGTGDAVAIHAGWPGVVAGIVTRAIEALGGEHRSALIGPHARACCYQFLGQAREQVLQALGPGYFREDCLDLTAAVVDQLRAAGVEVIDDRGACTVHDVRWYSWRRERTARRQAILVGPAR